MSRSRLAALGVALIAVFLTSCTTVEFSRLSESHGEFEAKGWCFTIFAIDIPKRAVDVPRENLSDARQPNMRVEEQIVTPYFGRFDWILDIISFRRATLRGTWGFAPAEATDGTSN